MVHLPDGSVVTRPSANAGDSGSVPELGRSLGQKDSLEKGMATHSSILARRDPIDRGVSWATVLGIAKNQT